MANLPGLVLKIGANTKDAIDGLNRVNRAVGQSASGADRMRASWRRAGPALGAAAAAAGALAVAIGVQSVRAAMEEEAELAKLNRTLGNLGFADASAQVNDFVDDLQFATGVADSELRPAFDRLVRSTGSVAEAQRVLQIALDTSVGTGRSLQQTAEALGRAYDGNTTGLSRLGAGLDKATLKTGDMSVITAQLAETFGGQAAAAADTLQGKMRILAVAADELQESLGAGLVEGFFTSLEQGGNDVTEASIRLREMQGDVQLIGETFGTALGMATTAFSTFIDVVKSVTAEAYYRIVGMELGVKSFALEVLDALGLVGDEEAALVRGQIEVARSANDAAYEEQLLAIHIGRTGDSASGATPAIQTYRRGVQDTGTEAKKAKTELQKLQAQMDVFARNRSIAGQRLSLAEMRREGPGKDGNLREFGLGYADQASRLASDIAERGGFSEKSKRRARRVLANARDYLGSLGLGGNFTDGDGAFLGTPNVLRGGTPNTRAAERVGDYEVRKMGTSVNIGTVVVQAQTPSEAVEKAKRWARLAAAGRGPAVPVGAVG